MRLEEIAEQLAGIRDDLARHYQFTGLADDLTALAEAVTAITFAEGRLRTILAAANASAVSS